MVRLKIPQEGTAKAGISEPTAPEPRETTRVLAVLQALKQDCTRLVKDGIDRLRSRWHSLPDVRHTLIRTGHELAGELRDWTAPLTDRLRSLAARTCVWYADVHQATGEPELVPNPALDRIREALSQGGAPDYNHQAPQPPFDNRTLAAAIVGLGDQFNAMHGLLIEMHGTLGQHGEMLGQYTGELNNLRGERMEKEAIKTLQEWLVAYSRERELPEPVIAVEWSDRHDDDKWAAAARRLHIPENANAVRRCDFLIRVAWSFPQPRFAGSSIGFTGDINPRPREFLIVGEASTQLNLGRQEKVVEQHGILTAAGHTDRAGPVRHGQRNRTVDRPAEPGRRADRPGPVPPGRRGTGLWTRGCLPAVGQRG